MSGEYVRSCTDRQEKAVGDCWRCEIKDQRIKELEEAHEQVFAEARRNKEAHEALKQAIADADGQVIPVWVKKALIGGG